jgi:hypothetical protein
LLESAICEAASSGGRPPGKLDISRLMAKIMIAHYWGGYSDAIHWGAADPYLRITPLGDVHFDHSFVDTVYEPFGRTGSERQVRDAIDHYAERYPSTREASGDRAGIEPEFVAAWKHEYGFSLEDLGRFVETLQEVCLEDRSVIAVMPSSRIAALIRDAAGVTDVAAADILRRFTLPRRPAWRIATDGFVGKDWYPWRFRRRLSVLRRPFLQLDSYNDPSLAFAPGLVHEAFTLTLATLHRGEIPDAQMESREMRRWLGGRNHRHRLAFNSDVAERLRELGWEARHEMNVTELVGKSLDRNYGDVDVVAWRPNSGRVLMIECKDVQYHKTLGEVAEQLQDFRGVVGSDGKPDLMKKHLDRVEVLRHHEAAIAKTLRLAELVQIEAHIVFKNPVPMRFVSERLASKINLLLFDELDKLG